MSLFADAIAKAEKIGTHKEKHAALSGFGPDEQRLIVETFNPFRVFNVKKFDMPKFYSTKDAPYTLFFDLLDKLNDRVLTGNSAKSEVNQVMSRYTEQTANVLARVLRKDLKCGADVDTFKKLYPGLSSRIPEFLMMFCAKIEYTKGKNGELIYNLKKYVWEFPCLGEVKYDGNRLIAIVKNGVVEYVSRSGLPSDYCSGIFDEELAKMEAAIGQPIVVDGEALDIRGFQATGKAKGKKADKSGLRFFSFDFMLLKDWEQKNCPMEQWQRTLRLENLISRLELKLVIKSKHKILNNMAEADAFYTEVIEEGLPGQDEGLIIKKLNGKYEWTNKRTTTWAKWKPVIDVDVVITGVYEGNPGTKNVGRLGGFLVEGEDENGNRIKSKCGGFKVNDKKFRAWFEKFCLKHGIDLEAELVGRSYDEVFRTLAWTRPELFIGETAMIECQSLSQAENSDTFALRFPQFIMLRDDKKVQALTK